MKKKIRTRNIIISTIMSIISIGVWVWYIRNEATFFDLIMFIFSVIMFAPLLKDVIWQFAIGNFALNYKPSLILRFFKEKNKRGNTDITKYYFLGRYYFDRADYEKAEKHFFKSIEAIFYKNVILKTDENKKFDSAGEQFGIENEIENFYKNNNDFVAFLKSSKLYLSKSYNFMIAGFDGFYLQNEPINYYVKTRKILYLNDTFLQDYDEEKRHFIENDKPLFDENVKLTKEQEKAKDKNDWKKKTIGSVDFRCIEVRFMLECDEYAYYEKALAISHEIVDIVEKSTNQTILWRLLYVRGCAYHKLGDADLACKDWKRGIELGDVEFSQKMYDENCKES